jgi:pilus assembly protein CpaB
VLASKVTGNSDVVEKFGENPPLSLLLKPGMRGISVEVSSLIGAGGLIRPGDHVDVILSVKTQGTTGDGGGGGGENQVAATILQNLEVVAIGQTVSASATAQTGEEGAVEDTNTDATTVTLSATPIQSEVLALADTCKQNFDGRLSLAVRSAGDGERFGVRTEWPGDGRTPDCASLLGITTLPNSFNFQ